MGLFANRKKIDNKTQVPVWFMRQAGRYHAHYQNIKKESDFMTMCKNPKLACDITMGPIEEFDFDAAILFSDLLFPLEYLGMGLDYNSGPPKLAFHLDSLAAFQKLHKQGPANVFFDFQKQAVKLLKTALPQAKTLLGFVGAPFTLYTYAVQGSHGGNLTDCKKGLYDGRFEAFLEVLIPDLLTEMTVQAEGGADAICLFDTAAGELTLDDFKKFNLPVIRRLTKQFKAKFPNTKLIYYSKMTHLNYLHAIEDEHIDVLGIDWRVDLSEALKSLSSDYYIQGNLDPSYLHLPWEHLKIKLDQLWACAQKSNINLDKWIMGLGHGVFPQTPEINVKKTVEYVHAQFTY